MSKDLEIPAVNSKRGDHFSDDGQCDHCAGQHDQSNEHQGNLFQMAVAARAEGFGPSLPAFPPSPYRALHSDISSALTHEGNAASVLQPRSMNFYGARALTNHADNTMQCPIGLLPHYINTAGGSHLESSLHRTSVPVSLASTTQGHFAMQPIAATHHSSIIQGRQPFLRTIMNQAPSYGGLQADQEQQLTQRIYEFQNTANELRLPEGSMMDSGTAGIGTSCCSDVPPVASLTDSVPPLHQLPRKLNKDIAATATLSKNKPKRPLSAYNIFFKEERERMIEEAQYKSSNKDFAEINVGDRETVKRRKKNHGIGFEEMAKEIGKRWKKIDAEVRAEYENKAKDDKKRYKTELELHKEKRLSELEAAREELESTVSEETRMKYLKSSGEMDLKRKATRKKK